MSETKELFKINHTQYRVNTRKNQILDTCLPFAEYARNMINDRYLLVLIFRQQCLIHRAEDVPKMVILRSRLICLARLRSELSMIVIKSPSARAMGEVCIKWKHKASKEQCFWELRLTVVGILECNVVSVVQFVPEDSL